MFTFYFEINSRYNDCFTNEDKVYILENYFRSYGSGVPTVQAANDFQAHFLNPSNTDLFKINIGILRLCSIYYI